VCLRSCIRNVNIEVREEGRWSTHSGVGVVS
jgi:hypothetical protein